MKANLLVPVLAVTLVAAGASIALAQPADSRFQLITELHISPGKNADFEAIDLARNVRMSDSGVTFPTRMTVREGLPAVYRQTTPGLENRAALDVRQAQLDAMPAGAPGAARGVIDHIVTSVRRTRPDLTFRPENPRVPGPERTFQRIVNIYLQRGALAEFEGLIGQVAALYEQHDVRNPLFVSSSAMGSGPDLRIVTPARDAADFYVENKRMTELLGADLQGLLMQMGALTRTVEYEHHTIRRDLWYQPAN